jgi:[ribosomal protein S5]-alanine N-acetyltransferase
MAEFDYSSHDVLRSSRTILRPVLLEDAVDVFGFRGDYEVTKYNSGVAFTLVDQARTLIASMIKDYDTKKCVRWGITIPSSTMISSGDSDVDAATATVISASLPVRGMVGFNYWDTTDHRASVGLELHRDEWGKGLMTEALTEVINFGFQRMKLNRIEAAVSVYNDKSLELLKRLFFEVEGVQKEQYYEDGEYHDLVTLALLKRNWVTKQQEEREEREEAVAAHTDGRQQQHHIANNNI